MPFPSPNEVAAKAEKAYPRFLKRWVSGRHDDFFPYRVRIRLTVDSRDAKGTIAASERLQAGSKAARGWGYTVHREQVRSRAFGDNRVPKSITIDTLDDLLRLAGKADAFAATRHIVQRVRAEFPPLEAWLLSHVASLEAVAEPIDRLIDVTRFFLETPWPDCYARQIPLSVDSKFVERNQALLRQWLDLLLPGAAIDVNETKFARRFGLRDGQPHRAIRLLDSALQEELGLRHDELSLPIRSIAELRVVEATVFVVENNLNLLTLPAFGRGIAIRGEGNAVNRLERLLWLHDNRLVYWGDIDVDGFVILSRLRNLFSHVESILMDCETMERHASFVVAGNGSSPAKPTNLRPEETAAFEVCSAANRRLEQEKILQPYVERTIEGLR